MANYNDSFYQEGEPGYHEDDCMSEEAAIKFGLSTGADFIYQWTEWQGDGKPVLQGWSFNYPPSCPGRHEKSLWRVCHDVVTYDLDEYRKEEGLA